MLAGSSPYSDTQEEDLRMARTKSSSTLVPAHSCTNLPRDNDECYHIPTSLICSPRSSRLDLTKLHDWLPPPTTNSSSELTTERETEGNTYALLGESTRREAVTKLSNRWTAVLFQEGQQLLLAVLLHQVRYVMAVKEMLVGGEKSYGISWQGRRPEMLFHSPKKLVHFYSLNPEMAFFDL